MKRFHVHVSVTDLAANIGFYSRLFGMPPTVAKDDYAKWMLDDPRVNFAISTRAGTTGLDHLGLQVDEEGELAQLNDAMQLAGNEIVTQTGTACCYAESDKHWTTDPNGIAWEAFHTLRDAPVFGSGAREGSACCAPPVATVSFTSRK
jgi:catechol 2,3-dioxygenase-like lactoylglutathione lyase family enzyme